MLTCRQLFNIKHIKHDTKLKVSEELYQKKYLGKIDSDKSFLDFGN